MTRKTMKINAETKSRIADLKRDGETWDGLLMRAADALQTDEDTATAPGTPRCTDCKAKAHCWTVEEGQLVCGACASAPKDELM